MERDDVLAHALDHPALLSRDDKSIQTVLERGWIDILQMRLPRPAGLVQSVTSNSQLLQDLSSANFSRTNNTLRNSSLLIVNQ